jgi:hypothetical protein
MRQETTPFNLLFSSCPDDVSATPLKKTRNDDPTSSPCQVNPATITPFFSRNHYWSSRLDPFIDVVGEKPP